MSALLLELLFKKILSLFPFLRDLGDSGLSLSVVLNLWVCSRADFLFVFKKRIFYTFFSVSNFNFWETFYISQCLDLECVESYTPGYLCSQSHHQERCQHDCTPPAQTHSAIWFSRLKQDQCLWRKCRLARWEVHLALWDALVIEGGGAQHGHTRWGRQQMPKPKKKKGNKKNKRNAPIDRCCSWQPRGGVHLTGTRLPLMRKRNDKGVKEKKRE